MPRVFKLLSVGLHALVIACVALAQFLDIGALPSPRRVLAFAERMVSIADVPLPAPPRATSPTAPGPSDRGAPIEAPPTIEPESTHEPVRSGVAGGVDLPGSENGIGTVPGGLGTTVLAPPPPPPPPPPVKPMRVHAGMQAPQKIVDVPPIYPALAQTVRRAGIVILEAVIDVKGRVESVRVLRSVPLLDEAAVAAVRQWRFTPALLNGQPVPVVMTVTVHFNLQ